MQVRYLKAMNDEGGKSKRGYHHGNLRQALVDAALGLIARNGPNGFSLSEAAKAAGVSAAAPYRHFKDRDEVLAEVARQGFDLFAERLERALDSGGPSPIRAFEAVTQAYLDFARTERPHFQAMFGNAPPDRPEVIQAGDRALEVLRRACAGLVRHLPTDQHPPLQMMSLHVWAMCHGIAGLFGRTESQRRAPISDRDLLESATAIYLRGLGLLPDA